MPNDKFTPKNQAQRDHAIALFEFERTHKIWIQTSVFSAAYERVKGDMEKARINLVEKIKIAHPTWGVM